MSTKILLETLFRTPFLSYFSILNHNSQRELLIYITNGRLLKARARLDLIGLQHLSWAPVKTGSSHNYRLSTLTQCKHSYAHTSSGDMINFILRLKCEKRLARVFAENVFATVKSARSLELPQRQKTFVK